MRRCVETPLHLGSSRNNLRACHQAPEFSGSSRNGQVEGNLQAAGGHAEVVCVIVAGVADGITRKQRDSVV